MLSNIIFEQATVNATRSVGSAKCSVTIPYSWNLSNRSTDQVHLSYLISAGVNSTTAGSLANRSSSQYIVTIKIPANGAITTETVNATI